MTYTRKPDVFSIWFHLMMLTCVTMWASFRR